MHLPSTSLGVKRRALRLPGTGSGSLREHPLRFASLPAPFRDASQHREEQLLAVEVW